jgi:hypothetical protein
MSRICDEKCSKPIQSSWHSSQNYSGLALFCSLAKQLATFLNVSGG